ncbi:MAG: hypothetical protein K2G40_05690 [Muribaculaceae bacterium]|nr:hypothetical protein [Muribaculaceae bacterium]
MNSIIKSNKRNKDFDREWQGYSLDELEHRRVVNTVKCELLKEQMTMVYGTTVNSLMGGNGRENRESQLENGISRIISYATYGAQAYKYVKSIINLYKSFKS